MPPKTKFTDGERVLCFHGNLLYEAKCVKSEQKEKTVRYFIHYNGWNKNWDEWVPESRVLKFGEPALQKQKELIKANQASKSKNLGTPGGRGHVGRPKKDKKGGVATPNADKEKEKDKPGPAPKEGESSSAATGDKVQPQATAAEARSSTPSDSRSHRAERAEGRKHRTDRESRGSTPVAETSTTTEKPSTTKEKTDKRKQTDKDKGDKGDKAEKDKDGESKDKDASLTSDRPSRGDRADKRKNVPGSSVQSSSGDQPTPEPKKKRSRMDATVEMEEVYATKVEVRIKAPDDLKPWMVDDWDLINRQKMLVTLPCKTTVDMILDDFTKAKLAKGNNPQKDAIIETCAGVRDYFNVMLGTQLLYKFERPQYAEVLADHPDIPMCKIYGAAHLLRLFVKLGSMLAYTPLDDKTMSLLLLHLHDILKYMSKNASSLFNVTDYVVASPEYHRKSL